MSSDSQSGSPLGRFLAAFFQERNIKWMLGLGMLILVGSSLMLVTAHWETYTPVWKYLVLLAYTAVVFGAGEVSYRQFGLRRTGTGLMALTTLLIPITFLALHWARPEAANAAGWMGRAAFLVPNLLLAAAAARRIFGHFLRGSQPTFLASYLVLAAAGVIVPALPTAWAPATALLLWGVFAAGTVKVNRRVFCLAEELRLPRIFGFFPIGLLGAQFAGLFATMLAPHVALQWIGLGLVLVAVPVMSTADALARIFQHRSGPLARPLPWSVVLPIIVGLALCAAGVCLAATGWPRPFALVPAAALAAGLLALIARRTRHPGFVWAMLAAVVLAYNFSPVFFRELAAAAVQQGAEAVREPRLPFAFYGLTYLPLLAGLMAAARWAQVRGSALFVQPLRHFSTGLACLLLAVSFTHAKAIFPVALVLTGVFAAQAVVFGSRPLMVPGIAAWIAAAYGFPAFAAGVLNWPTPEHMVLLSLSAAAGALFVAGVWLDRPRAGGRMPGLSHPSGPSLANDGSIAPARPDPWEMRTAGNVPYCRLASLGLSLVIAAAWLVVSVNTWSVPAGWLPAALSGALLVLHALRWRSPALGTAVLTFLGTAMLIVGGTRGVPTETLIGMATASLGGLWLLSYVLMRTPGSAVSRAFSGPATHVSLLGLAFLIPTYYLPRLGMATFREAVEVPWLLSLLAVGWAFDAARRLRHPALALFGCVGVLMLVGAATAALLGPAAAAPWLAAAWAATALVALPVSIRLAHVTSIAGPIRWTATVVLLASAAASLAFFSSPLRIAGGLGLAGLFLLAGLRRDRGLATGTLVLANWQLLAAVVQIARPEMASLFELSMAQLAGCALPLAAAAAGSLVAWRVWDAESSRSPDEPEVDATLPAGPRGSTAADSEAARSLASLESVRKRGQAPYILWWHRHQPTTSGSQSPFPDRHLVTHCALLEWLTAGMLLASLWLLSTGLGPVEAALAVAAFGGLAAAELLAACRRRAEWRVWLALGALAAGAGYLALFGVIGWNQGMSLYAVLAAGLAAWGCGRLAERSPRTAVLSGPFLKIGMALPMVSVAVGVVRHVVLPAPNWLGFNSLALLLAAAFYFWQGIERRRRELLVLAALVVNVALALLWLELAWSDPQFFLVPLGASILGLVHLLKDEIPAKARAPLYYLGALVILVSPTFQIVGGSWVHLLALMVLSVGVALVALGLRVRALMYLGTAFLAADLVAMVVRGSIDHPTLLWIAGIALGAAVISLAAYCERHRERVLQRLRLLAAQLETWD